MKALLYLKKESDRIYSAPICCAILSLLFLISPLNAGPDSSNFKTIHVVSHGWHTGVILDSEAIPDSLKPAHPLFHEHRHLEFGWGDRAFYENPDPDIDYWLAFKAAVIPTESVLHVVGFNESVETYFSYSELVGIEISEAHFLNLYQFIKSSFARDSLNRIIPLGKGLYGNSRFFSGKAKYYFPYTCNVWTAQALKSGGISISPLRFQRAGELMKYLKELNKKTRDSTL